MDEALCLSLGGHDNDAANRDNITFTNKDKILVVVVVTLSGKDNKKISKFFSKVFKRSVCWNEYKTRSENKNLITTHISSNQTL